MKSAGITNCSCRVKDFSRIVDTFKTGKSGGYLERTVFLTPPSTLSTTERAPLMLVSKVYTINGGESHSGTTG